MASNIDPTKPSYGKAYTSEVRKNFQYAKDEIEELQKGTFAVMNLPKSNAGLPPGALWNNGGYVCIV
jgi:hypothetical protein